jgi:hypothetical protein
MNGSVYSHLVISCPMPPPKPPFPLNGAREMNLKTFSSAKEFYLSAGDWLNQKEGVNSIALGVIKDLMSERPSFDEAYFASVMDNGQIIGTAMLTPPHPVNLNATDLAAIPHFVEFAKQIKRPGSVLGPGRIAKEFARHWCHEMACALAGEEAQAIHKLERVNHPKPFGTYTVIVADESQRKLLEEWSREFCMDCRIEDRIEDIPRQVSRAIATGSRYLLLVEGKPVSMAGRSRETTNGGSVNAVYTPKNLRGRGYASALVAWISQSILDSGKKAVYLYTQLDNPTSNKIYYSLGYRVISDSWHIRFRY